jgi:uncharacterized membrane protein
MEIKIEKVIITCFCIFLLSLSFVSATNNETTQNQASTAIIQAEQDMQEMKDAGFSVIYINDTLTTAKQIFEKINKINIPGFSYDEVLKYTQEISTRKEKAYEINDQIRALELKIKEYEASGVNTSKTIILLEEAKKSFKDERYDEIDQILIDAQSQLESDKAEITLTNVMAKAGENFIQKNWIYIIIFILVLTLVIYLLFRRIRKVKAKNKLKTAKMEEETILELIKEIQRQRFENGTISDTTYRLKMKLFKEKLTEIKHTIPVLEYIINGKKKV